MELNLLRDSENYASLTTRQARQRAEEAATDVQAGGWRSAEVPQESGVREPEVCAKQIQE